MNHVHFNYLVPALMVTVVLTTGCTSMASQTDTVSSTGQDAVLQKKDQEISTLQSKIGQLRSALAGEQQKTTPTAGVSDTELLPPNAKPGECYARVFIPPQFKTDTQRVLKREATSRIETSAPKFAWGEERVLVKEASSRLEVLPATYAWVEERVLVTPASTRLSSVPAVYDTVTEKILDKPAHTVWKKGSGPITKVDEATGEIMCLVDVPATYRTVSKRVQVKGPSTQEASIPAEYKTVKKRVQKTPPSTRTIEIPAEYKSVKVKKLVEPAKTNTINIPEEYTTITKKVKVSEGHIEWKPILCKTNTTRGVVQRIQSALKTAGYNPGPIDGVLGRQTMSAVKAYQTAKKLPTGGLTLDTLKSLKVMN